MSIGDRDDVMDTGAVAAIRRLRSNRDRDDGAMDTDAAADMIAAENVRAYLGRTITRPLWGTLAWRVFAYRGAV